MMRYVLLDTDIGGNVDSRGWVDAWLARHDAITFNDPLAAACVFEQQLCRFERGTIDVDTTGPDRGRTRWTPADDGPHEIAVDVDLERFVHHLSGVFGGA